MSEAALRAAKQLEKFHLLARLTPAPNTQYVPLAETASVIAAEYAALEAEVATLRAGLRCFSCDVEYTSANKDESCDMAHRDHWSHEWVSERVCDLTRALCEANAEVARLKARNQELFNSLPLIDNRTRNEAEKLLGSTERQATGEFSSAAFYRHEQVRPVVEGLLADNTALGAEVARLKAERTSGRVARGSGEVPMHLDD